MTRKPAASPFAARLSAIARISAIARLPAIARLLATLGLALAAATAAGLAQAAPTRLAYVSSEKDDAITVIDLKTLEVKGSIATCKRPRHMQMLPGSERRMIVVCSNSDRADVIDLGAGKAVDAIPLDEDPELLDISPDGKTLYVSNEDDSRMSMVDIATKKVVRTVATGPEPEGVKVSPDGKLVYVASEVANIVHVIDTATGRILDNITVGNRPRRFEIPQARGLAWRRVVDTSLPTPDDIRPPGEQPLVRGTDYPLGPRSVVVLEAEVLDKRPS